MEISKNNDNLLIDGSAPMTSSILMLKLKELGIKTTTIDHDPIFTVEDSIKEKITPRGPGNVKNLFLKNKKGQMWLLCCNENTQVNLKILASDLGAGRFSFGSQQRLMHYLGVLPGSVSPLALINDKEYVINFIIEDSLLHARELNLHPLVNTKTTTISLDDLYKFMEYLGRTITSVSLNSGS
tara:strand:- start:411 stop:959 length:549 start_codon:yes stop_codon:yes gene_type:complete